MSASPTSTTLEDAALEQDSGLSVGAKAGIGVGAAIGAIAILALASTVIWYRRRLRRLENGRAGQHLPTNGIDRYDDKMVSNANPSPHEPLYVPRTPLEVDSSAIYEMQGQGNRRG